MKEVVYIVGHKNPDTDSVVSALGLAELFKKNFPKEGKKWQAVLFPDG